MNTTQILKIKFQVKRLDVQNPTPPEVFQYAIVHTQEFDFANSVRGQTVAYPFEKSVKFRWNFEQIHIGFQLRCNPSD